MSVNLRVRMKGRVYELDQIATVQHSVREVQICDSARIIVVKQVGIEANHYAIFQMLH